MQSFRYVTYYFEYKYFHIIFVFHSSMSDLGFIVIYRIAGSLVRHGDTKKHCRANPVVGKASYSKRVEINSVIFNCLSIFGISFQNSDSLFSDSVFVVFVAANRFPVCKKQSQKNIKRQKHHISTIY